MSVFLTKVCKMPKLTLYVFTLMISPDFCPVYKEKLHFLKRLMVPMANFLEYITNWIVFFLKKKNKALQPAHLLCVLDGVLKLGFPCLFTVH